MSYTAYRKGRLSLLKVKIVYCRRVWNSSLDMCLCYQAMCNFHYLGHFSQGLPLMGEVIKFIEKSFRDFPSFKNLWNTNSFRFQVWCRKSNTVISKKGRVSYFLRKSLFFISKACVHKEKTHNLTKNQLSEQDQICCQ